jgi:hypothetical protein
MAEQRKNEAGGDNRSEIVSVGLDPKLRYLAELGSRKYRRALSNYIEWAIEEGLKKVALWEHPADASLDISIAKASYGLWDVHEADRFVKLAHDYPGLLTDEELVLWELIRKNDSLWRKDDKSLVFSDDPVALPLETHFIFERLREHWDAFKAVARGEADRATLPATPEDTTEG